jgi:hypothetical protein
MLPVAPQSLRLRPQYRRPGSRGQTHEIQREVGFRFDFPTYKELLDDITAAKCLCPVAKLVVVAFYRARILPQEA